LPAASIKLFDTQHVQRRTSHQLQQGAANNLSLLAVHQTLHGDQIQRRTEPPMQVIEIKN